MPQPHAAEAGEFEEAVDALGEMGELAAVYATDVARLLTDPVSDVREAAGSTLRLWKLVDPDLTVA